MSKYSNLSLFLQTFLLLGGLSSFVHADSLDAKLFGDHKKIIIGKWTITNDCTNDYYQFLAKKIVHKTDVDGDAIVDKFVDPIYLDRKKSILIDFRKEHGIGGTKDRKIIIISFADNNTAFIYLKKGTLELSRCP